MIGIIFIGDILYCPYLKKYEEVLGAGNFELIYWRRGAENEPFQAENHIVYQAPSSLAKHPLQKLTDFYGFRRFVKKVLKEKKYEKLILLSTLSGILFYRYLPRRYSGRYIFDIRDYSYEAYSFFRAWEKKLIAHSYFTCISSKGFKNFLPPYDYVITHNFQPQDLEQSRNFQRVPYRKGEPVTIVFNGSLRHLDHDIHFIEEFKNDSRFRLIFNGIGATYTPLKEYVEKGGFTNVTLTGAYKNEEKPRLLAQAHLINNQYPFCPPFTNLIENAVSNKFYDSILYKIPQIVAEGTYTGKLVREYGIGMELSARGTGYKEAVWDYMQRFNPEQFDRGCEQLLEQVLKEDALYGDKIKEFKELNIK